MMNAQDIHRLSEVGQRRRLRWNALRCTEVDDDDDDEDHGAPPESNLTTSPTTTTSCATSTHDACAKVKSDDAAVVEEDAPTGRFRGCALRRANVLTMMMMINSTHACDEVLRDAPSAVIRAAKHFTSIKHIINVRFNGGSAAGDGGSAVDALFFHRYPRNQTMRTSSSSGTSPTICEDEMAMMIESIPPVPLFLPFDVLERLLTPLSSTCTHAPCEEDFPESSQHHRANNTLISSATGGLHGTTTTNRRSSTTTNNNSMMLFLMMMNTRNKEDEQLFLDGDGDDDDDDGSAMTHSTHFCAAAHASDTDDVRMSDDDVHVEDGVVVRCSGHRDTSQQKQQQQQHDDCVDDVSAPRTCLHNTTIGKNVGLPVFISASESERCDAHTTTSLMCGVVEMSPPPIGRWHQHQQRVQNNDENDDDNISGNNMKRRAHMADMASSFSSVNATPPDGGTSPPLHTNIHHGNHHHPSVVRSSFVFDDVASPHDECVMESCSL